MQEGFLDNLALNNSDMKLFVEALGSSQKGVVITDHGQPDEPIVYCNVAFSLLTGYSKKEIIGHNCRFLQEDDRQEEPLAEISKAIEQGGYCKVSIRNYKKNGELFWNELIISPIRDRFGKVTHFIGIQNEVSGRLITEKEKVKRPEGKDVVCKKLEDEMENYQAAIMESLRDSFILLDNELRIVGANQHFWEFFKLSKDKVLRKTLSEIEDGSLNSYGLESLLKNVLDFDDPFDGFEMGYNSPSIGRRILKLNGRWLVLDGKQQEKILLVIEDITQQKTREYSGGDFITIASHELKTPLTSVKANLQFLEKMAQKKEDLLFMKGFLTAGRSVARLEQLISEMLNVGKFQSGKIDLQTAPFNVSELIERAIKFSKEEYPDRKIVVDSLSETILTGDLGKLTQVLINLISNAVKFSPASNKVSIGVVDLSDYLKVSVVDEGIGINKREHKRIFDQFYKAEGISERFAGLGLGLHVCKEIIELHNGTLWVESEEQKGATFSFTIPVL